MEILADYSVTVPEIGTFRADVPPVVVVTSNRTRDVHDALKRRCLYHWVAHPDVTREIEIILLQAPEVGRRLAVRVAAAAATIREIGLYKPPGVAETIDWARALTLMGDDRLALANVDATLGALLKYREDHDRVRDHGLASVIAAAQQ